MTISGRLALNSIARRLSPRRLRSWKRRAISIISIRAAAVLRGDANVDKKIPKNPYDDSDVFKVIEGASYALRSQPDPQLDAFLDQLIARIGAAQEKDGYLYTARTIDPLHPHIWAGPERWMLDRELSHELYNLGHLYEAAMAHYQATGKRTLLDIALRSADLLDRTFGPGKMTIWPGHQVAEIGPGEDVPGHWEHALSEPGEVPARFARAGWDERVRAGV